MFNEKRKLFFKLTNIITLLNSLSFTNDFDTIVSLERSIIDDKDYQYILPSGCVGNVLALALELHLFPAALHIISNSSRLGIDLDQCSYHPKYGIKYSAKDIFECVTKNEELIGDLKIEHQIIESKESLKLLLK